jgi:hypothetical protein
MSQRHRARRFEVHVWPQEWWVGVQVGRTKIYVCAIPCVVIQINRGDRPKDSNGQ